MYAIGCQLWFSRAGKLNVTASFQGGAGLCQVCYARRWCWARAARVKVSVPSTDSLTARRAICRSTLMHRPRLCWTPTWLNKVACAGGAGPDLRARMSGAGPGQQVLAGAHVSGDRHGPARRAADRQVLHRLLDWGARSLLYTRGECERDQERMWSAGACELLLAGKAFVSCTTLKSDAYA